MRIKQLKFHPELCTQIITGKKTVTWRVYDDKQLASGDRLEFINSETKRPFGTGEILTVKT